MLFNIAKSISAVVGTTDVSTYAKLGTMFIEMENAHEKMDVSGVSVSTRLLAMAQTIVKASSEISADDRNPTLTAGMKDIHGKAVKATVKANEIDITTYFKWPETRTHEKTGKRLKGLQIVGRYMSLNAPELDEQPTIDLIVPGGTFKTVVSDVAKLWYQSDSDTVMACTTYGDVKAELKRIAEAEKASGEDTESGETEETVDNDRAKLYAMFAEVTAQFDLTGNTLDADILTAAKQAFVDGLAAMKLKKVS